MSVPALLALVHEALGADARIVHRRVADHASSLPVEELVVRTQDGSRVRLAAKHLAPVARPPRPVFLVDADREPEIYRSVLEPLDLGTPRCLAAGDGIMLLEWVEGTPLWQAEGIEPWEAAARWLARLHAAPVPPGARRLLAHDGPHLRRWIERACALVPAAEELREAALLAVECLEHEPTCLVHGEFFPANVLVDGGAIHPLDWETAGIGPGVLDLAALVAGVWPGDEPLRITRAYARALPPERRPTDVAIAAAQLLVALQWLGWAPSWSPPPEQANDWLAAARRAAVAVAA